MSTSKYGAGSERDIGYYDPGELHIHFTVEPAKTKKEERKNVCALPLAWHGIGRAQQVLEDNDERSLEDQLDIVVEMLVSAEVSYRIVWSGIEHGSLSAKPWLKPS